MMPIHSVRPIVLSMLLVIVGFMLGLVQNGNRIFEHCVGFAWCDDACAFELLSIELAHCRVCANSLVHLRLGEGRLVTFVVSPAPIADEVNQDVFMTLLPIG